MSTSPQSQPRWKYALQAIVLGLVVTACIGMVLFLGTRNSVRIDMTATREHELSPRSKTVLKDLDRELTLVIAYDGQQIKGNRLGRTLDVLDKFQRASPRFQWRAINTASPKGLEEYDQLIAGLAQQDGPEIQKHAEAIDAAAKSCEELATRIEIAADGLLPLRETMAAHAPEASRAAIRQVWDAQAAELRSIARNLREGAARAIKVASQTDGGIPIPPLDKAEAEFKKPLADCATSLAALGENLATITKDVARPDDVKTRAQAVAAMLPQLRDKALRTAADLDALGQVRMLLIARAIQRTQAALLIDTSKEGGAAGLRGLTAIDLKGLFPDAAAGMDLRFRAEELLAGAITSLSAAPKPLVVIVHSAQTKIAPQFGGFRVLLDQLQMRGIELTEWAVASEAEPPKIVIDAEKSRSRPVVYVTLPDEVKARPESAVAMGKLANAVRDLIKTGRAALISINPSSLAANGSTDPLVEVLPSIGLSADSARPLMEEFKAAEGRTVSPDQLLMEPGGSHPISRAIGGMRTLLLWPIPLTRRDAPGVTVSELITIPAEPGLWAESDWQPIRGVRLDRMTSSQMPAKDSPRDDAGTGSGWLVAAAAERPNPEIPGASQRVVVVGSNYWFVDGFAQKDSLVDGKVVKATPGNTEFFLAAVSWLAHQDDQIATGVSAASLPVIRPLTDQQQRWLNWSLLAIGPGLVLLAGLAWRLWRG
ncbi:MAG: hypothetical protein ACREJO_10620 [Phycisphaerales bacterium]